MSKIYFESVSEKTGVGLYTRVYFSFVARFLHALFYTRFFLRAFFIRAYKIARV